MINIRPYITEKSVKMAQSEKFTLIVPQDATKAQIKEAVKSFFKLTPISISTAKKTQLLRLKLRRKSADRGFKKAIIALKKGERIPGFEIVSDDSSNKKKGRKEKVEDKSDDIKKSQNKVKNDKNR